MTIDGHWLPELQPVADAFAENFARHDELGAAVAIYIDGREALSLWGGYADVKRTQPWQRDTLIAPASSVKGMFGLVIHKLVSDGRLSFEDRVADHWPAFAQNGKEAMTVRQLIGQTGGLQATFPINVMEHSLAEILPVMETAVPSHQPGTHGAYHSQTLMPLLAGLCYKVTGEQIAPWFRREIAGPWAIDAHLTLPESEFSRAGETVLAAGSYYHALMARVTGGEPPAEDLVIPPGSKHLYPYATARGYARLWGGVANGGTLDGVRLYSQAATDACAQVQWNNRGWYPFPVADDDYKAQPQAGTLGFFQAGHAFAMGQGARAWGMPGAGGNLAMADPDRRLGFGYVCNRWWSQDGMGPRIGGLMDALYRCV